MTFVKENGPGFTDVRGLHQIHSGRGEWTNDRCHYSFSPVIRAVPGIGSTLKAVF
jgi:hypothetical protein